jgi:hypothetical protein
LFAKNGAAALVADTDFADTQEHPCEYLDMSVDSD